MNNLKYIFTLMVGALMFASCSDGTVDFVSEVKDGPNLASFTNASQVEAQVSNGSEYELEIPMLIHGPTIPKLSEDITVTVETDWTGIDESARAEPGTHFSLASNEITLTAENDYQGTLAFTMLTDGIDARTVSESPQFNLKVTGVSGGSNVIISGKPSTNITLNYACISNIQGTYDVAFVDAAGDTISYEVEEGVFEKVTYSDVEVVKGSGIGQYTTDIIGVFQVGGSDFRPNNDIGNGLTFTDVCGKLSVPGQTLGIYSNAVAGTEGTQITPPEAAEDGSFTSFTLKYSVDGFEDYTAIYTKQ